MTMIAVVGLSVAASAAGPIWAHAAGSRISTDGTMDIRLWWRGTDAVVEERADGRIVWQAACRGTTLTELNHATESTVTRSNLSPTDCFRWATGSSLAIGLEVVERGLVPTRAVVDGSVVIDEFETGDQTSRIGLIRGWGLPKFVETGDQERIDWEYRELRRSTTAPPTFESPEAWAAEKYEAITLAEASTRASLGALPRTVGNLPFYSAFLYRPANSSDLTLYVLWGSAEDQVQLVRGVGPLPASELGTRVDGEDVVYKAQFGKDYVQIFASSRSELELLVSSLALDPS